VDFVTGIGRTKFGRLQESGPQLIAAAIREALVDSNFTPDDIQAAYVANFAGGPLISQLHLGALVSSLLKSNIPSIRVESACASGGVAILQARMALQHFDPILVIGVEKMSDTPTPAVAKRLGMAGCALNDQRVGLIFPANYALMANEHMNAYETEMNDLSLVSLKNHNNARLNPLAHFFHKEVDLELIENSPIVCTPLRLFDCSPISDGAAAVILSRKQHKKYDPHFLASAMATDSLSVVERKNLTSLLATRNAARKAYDQAGCRPGQISFAQVHDCFTIAEIVAMEDLGFAPAGKGSLLIRENATSLEGRLPINTDGGLKGDGHPIGATGVAQLYETIVQLRGTAGKRQVREPGIGLTHNVGGTGGSCAVNILKGGKV